MSMSISIVLPCIFFLKICSASLTKLDVVCSVCICLFGIITGTLSTYQAVAGIAGKY
jgi:predicted permease